MKQFNVNGMSCAACSAKVEKAVLKVEGVEACNVSLLTNSMAVEGKADEKDIIKAVENAGYGASLKGSSQGKNSLNREQDELVDTETPKLLKRLLASLIILLPLMYVSMGHMMWAWPVPEFLENPISIGIYEMLLSSLVMFINQKFFVNGFKGLIHKAPNMDTLIAMGSMASFLYSLVALFKICDKAHMEAIISSGCAGNMDFMNDFYFESAAMILTLITVGKTLEARSKGKTTDAIKGLMKLAPKTATKLIDGKEVESPIEELVVGDKFVVKAGENIPVDGKILEGSCAVNEAALTGESIPVDKKPGDLVSAATTNQSGYIICQATRVGEDTTLSQIIQMVSDAAATKAPIAKIADKVSGVFVPAVLAISLVTFIIWLIAGKEIGDALTRAVAVLVISCPCALGLATPVAIMVGNGKAARAGIMFKTAVSLEETGKVDMVVLDKTGTITEGKPVVTSIVVADDLDEKDLLLPAYSIENKSSHPLSRAVVEYAKENNLEVKEVSDFEEVAGSGLKCILDGQKIIAGNYEFVSKSLRKADSQSEKTGILDNDANQKVLKDLNDKVQSLVDKGHTPLYFTNDNKVLGIITVADTIKADSHEGIANLKKLGLQVVMLTGDNEKTAKAIGESVGVDALVANVKPEGKEEVIKLLQKHGKVAMVGDGINDAPALTRADIGIAIGAGTDIAIDSADLVLMKSSINDVAAAIRLSRHTLTNIHENLFWAFIFNIIGIPLAAGLWIPIFGWTLKPMFGAAAMSLSSFIVVSNALRINLFNLYDFSKAKERKSALAVDFIYENTNKENTNQMEDKKMEITVNGMMCHHCEAHVKAALEKIDGVVEAVANHEANLVTIKTDKEVSEEVIRAAVVEVGYEYVGIK